MISNLALLNTIIIIGIIIAAACCVFIDKILPCIIAMSVMGSFVALEFLLLRAPDVAIAEGAVGAILTPVIFIIALYKVEGKKTKKDVNKEENVDNSSIVENKSNSAPKKRKLGVFTAYFSIITIVIFAMYVAVKMASLPSTYNGIADLIVKDTLKKTGAVNSVTAVVFDFRGYDTLGESFVLFTAIIGVATILRKNKKLKEEKKNE